MRLFNLEAEELTAPYFIYKRLPLSHFREYYTFQISYGFGFLLRRLAAKYPETVSGSTVQSDDLKLEFFDNANYTARQPAAFSLALISTPGKDGAKMYAAPQPADASGYNLNFSAAPYPKSSGTLNFLYKYGDVLRIDITGQRLDPVSGLWVPNYLDLLLKGYYVPELSEEQYSALPAVSQVPKRKAA
jgi:hypothetical protein